MIPTRSSLPPPLLAAFVPPATVDARVEDGFELLTGADVLTLPAPGGRA